MYSEQLKLAKLAEFQPAWVAAEAEREAMEIKWLEDYVGCKPFELPKEDVAFHGHLKNFLHTFVFDHRADDIPEGKGRWE
jgi:hypothetical protein